MSNPMFLVNSSSSVVVLKLVSIDGDKLFKTKPEIGAGHFNWQEFLQLTDKAMHCNGGQNQGQFC